MLIRYSKAYEMFFNLIPYWVDKYFFDVEFSNFQDSIEGEHPEHYMRQKLFYPNSVDEKIDLLTPFLFSHTLAYLCCSEIFEFTVTEKEKELASRIFSYQSQKEELALWPDPLARNQYIEDFAKRFALSLSKTTGSSRSARSAEAEKAKPRLEYFLSEGRKLTDSMEPRDMIAPPDAIPVGLSAPNRDYKDNGYQVLYEMQIPLFWYLAAVTDLDSEALERYIEEEMPFR